MVDLAPIILSLAARHGHHDDARLRAVASDIATVAVERPVYCGLAAVDATALALVAIAEHESGWHPGVQDGSRCLPGGDWCDRGRSISLYQLRIGIAWGGYTRDEINGDDLLAARLSLRVLRRYIARGSIESQFAGYASGGMMRTRAGTEIAAIYGTLLLKHRIVVTYRHGCLYAESML